MVERKVDSVNRPDHYRCLDCSERFNDAKFIRNEAGGIHSAVASCPKCSSTRIKISWWKPKTK
jgi:DNA-directed RNA polymerase subunit RPC12/RpoP